MNMMVTFIRMSMATTMFTRTKKAVAFTRITTIQIAVRLIVVSELTSEFMETLRRLTLIPTSIPTRIPIPMQLKSLMRIAVTPKC